MVAANRPPPEPPSLNLHLGQKLKLLLLMNILPIIVVAWVAYGLSTGQMRLRAIPDDWLLVVASLVALGIVAITLQWFLLPIARWCWRWPRWHVRHRGFLWWPIALGGGAVYLAMWLLAIAVVLLGLVIIGYQLLGIFAGSGDAPVAAAGQDGG